MLREVHKDGPTWKRGWDSKTRCFATFAECCARYRLNYEGKEGMTYRMYSMELRVDMTDERKFEALQKYLQLKGKEMLGFAGLLKDHQNPQITLFSHDHSVGHLDIPLLASDAETDYVSAKDEADTAADSLLAGLKDV